MTVAWTAEEITAFESSDAAALAWVVEATIQAGAWDAQGVVAVFSGRSDADREAALRNRTRGAAARVVPLYGSDDVDEARYEAERANEAEEG